MTQHSSNVAGCPDAQRTGVDMVLSLNTRVRLVLHLLLLLMGSRSLYVQNEASQGLSSLVPAYVTVDGGCQDLYQSKCSLFS